MFVRQHALTSLEFTLFFCCQFLIFDLFLMRSPLRIALLYTPVASEALTYGSGSNYLWLGKRNPCNGVILGSRDSSVSGRLRRPEISSVSMRATAESVSARSVTTDLLLRAYVSPLMSVFALLALYQLDAEHRRPAFTRYPYIPRFGVMCNTV